MKILMLWLIGLDIFAYGAVLEVSSTTTYIKASPFMHYYADINQTLNFEDINNVKWKPIQKPNLTQTAS